MNDTPTPLYHDLVLVEISYTTELSVTENTRIAVHDLHMSTNVFDEYNPIKYPVLS